MFLRSCTGMCRLLRFELFELLSCAMRPRDHSLVPVEHAAAPTSRTRTMQETRNMTLQDDKSIL